MRQWPLSGVGLLGAAETPVQVPAPAALALPTQSTAAMLTVDQLVDIKALHMQGLSIHAIAATTGLARSNALT